VAAEKTSALGVGRVKKKDLGGDDGSVKEMGESRREMWLALRAKCRLQLYGVEQKLETEWEKKVS
jgi:hypothetical protein